MNSFDPNAVLPFYSDNLPERIGFVLADGAVVEVENVAPERLTKMQFCFAPEDLVRYEDTAVATWHTHPGGTGCLTVADHAAFQNWPDWDHLIIGKDGLWSYYVQDGEVIRR